MKNQKILFVVGWSLLSTLAIVLSFEIYFAITNPYETFGSVKELKGLGEEKWKKIFTIDQEFGLRPILGTDYYSYFGTLKNNYSIEKKAGITRVLFIGDSVTSRGKIIAGLKDVYGTTKFEYWNAGVDSFNTVQEVKYYMKYNFEVKPDHVILTFVLNDFDATPIAFFNQSKELAVFSPKTTVSHLSPFLFQHSYIYRRFISLLVVQKNSDSEDLVKMNLSDLSTHLKKDGIAFSVVISPILKPYREWSQEEKNHRDKIISILKNLNIRYFDLTELVDKAQQKGIPLPQQDRIHPESKLAVFFAQHLYTKNLFTNSDTSTTN